eukprot:1978657-Prymnesium_polylepis.1
MPVAAPLLDVTSVWLPMLHGTWEHVLAFCSDSHFLHDSQWMAFWGLNDTLPTVQCNTSSTQDVVRYTLSPDPTRADEGWLHWREEVERLDYNISYDVVVAASPDAALWTEMPAVLRERAKDTRKYMGKHWRHWVDPTGVLVRENESRCGALSKARPGEYRCRARTHFKSF